MWFMAKKETVYLWSGNYQSEEEVKRAKEQYVQAGFRVVVIYDGNPNKDIEEALKLLIKAHV